MTDPLEQDVLSFLGGYKPLAPKPADPLEADVLSFLAAKKPPVPPAAANPAPARDPILDRLPPALAADFEKRPEFAAKLAKDRAAGLTDDQIVAKIAAGQQVKPKRPAWAANAPSTAEAQSDVLYGQPSGMETAVEAGLRGVAATKGNVGALMERFGRKAELPPEDDPEMDAAHKEALVRARAIYSVGAPGVSLTPIAETIARPVIENVAQPMVEKGEAIQRESEAKQQALPRPKYARNFVEGLKTDPLKTLAISGIENLPQLATTIGAAAISPELGLGAAWAQETGGAYQEAKQRGATEKEAQTISGIVGATNMFLEYLPAGKALETLGGATRSGVKGFLYDLLEQAVSEGATESIQEANQMVVEAAMSAKDQGFTFDQFRDRVLEAGLSAFVLGGATGVAAHVGGSVATDGPAVKPSRVAGEGDKTLIAAMTDGEVAALPAAIREVAGGATAGVQNQASGADEVPLVIAREDQSRDNAIPIVARPPASDALTPRTPRWASTHREAVDGWTGYVASRIAAEPEATYIPLSPEDIPFDLVNLPLVRWQDRVQSGSANSVRKGKFYLLGDQLLYAGNITESEPSSELFTPRNPLVLLRNKRDASVVADNRLIAGAARQGHDAIVIFNRNTDLGHVEVVKTPLAGRGSARSTVLYDWLGKFPSRATAHLLTEAATSRDAYAAAAREYNDWYTQPTTRGTVREPLVFPDYPGDEAAAALRSELLRISPGSLDWRSLLGEHPELKTSIPDRSKQAGVSDAELEADVHDFLSKREEPPVPIVDRRLEPQPAGEPRERRGDMPTRKRVAEMTPEEMTAALLTSEATGLPNRRAWEEQAADKPVHIAIDADGLKWVNDRFGHDTGTHLLRTLGEAIGPLGAYHLQGDEFAMAADTTEEAEARARQIDEALAGTRLRYTADDGSIYEIPIGASYGIGETYAAADQRSLEAKTEREARGQRAPRGEAPPGLVVVPPAGRQAGGREGGAVETAVQSETAAPEPRAQEPPPSEVSQPGTVAAERAAGQAPEPAVAPVAHEVVPEPAPTRDRGPESLPARLVRPGQAAGQEGFAVVPSAIKKPVTDWVKKRFTQQGLAPAYYLDLKIKRDNQLAAKAARLDAYSIDLTRAIRKYKGPLTPTQLKIYLDDAYRGMNLFGISGPMDETQIARIKERRQLSEVAAQRLREESSPGGLKSAPEFMPLLREMRSAQDDLARTLRRYGLLDDASIQQLEREFGLYVHRQYEAPRNPKYLKWVKKQPLWNRAYDLTKSLWDRQFAADRAEMIVDDLHLRRPPIDGPLRQGEEVEIGPAGEPKKAPKAEGEEELTRAAAAKPKPGPEIEEVAVERGKIKIKTLQFLGSDSQQQVFEIRAKPGESRAAAEARIRAEAEAKRDAMYPVNTSESLPSGRTGRIVQVKGGEVFVETLNEDGKRETLAVPTTRVVRKFGTKTQAIADVRRAMLDPTTRDQFLGDYQLDAETFDESHAKAREAMPDMPESEIWGMLHSYVESSGNRPVLPGGVPEGSKDMSSLKRRGRKDDLERLLKSEVRSVDWNFLTTTLKMATIVAQHRFLVDLERAGRGDIFVEKPEVRNAGTDKEQALTEPIDPGFYAKSIENAKGREPGIDQRVIMQGNKKMAPLADLFTTDEMMEAMNQAFDQKSNPAWLRWYMRGVIMAKGAATAQSLISLMRNVWSQPLAVSANGVNPFNMRRFAEAGKLSYPRAVGSTDRTRLARMERYIELGIVDQGTDVGDIKRMEKRAQVLREDIPHGAGHLGGRILREGSRGVMKLYEAPDNQGKIEVFEALLPLYKKAFPEMTTQEVEEHLAAKQRNTMQNYSMTPPLVKDVSQFPFIGSFVSFRMESIRNLYNAIKVAAEEVRSDNPELKKVGLRRTAGIAFALASTGAIASALRYWHNMDDDDDEAIRRFMAPWNKNSQVAFLHSIDEDGNVAFIDLSFMDYYSAVKTPFHALLRGDLAGVRDSVLDPFGEDVFTKNVMDIWARGGKTKDGFDVYNQQDSTLTKSIEITKHLGAPLTPGVIKQAARVLDPERDRSSEILGLFGVRKTVVNVPKELRRQAKLFADAINDSRWIEKRVIRKPGSEEAYAEAQRRSEVALRRNIEEFIRDIQAARQLGLPESEIAAALIESGFSKGNAAKGQIGEAGLLLGGEVDALVQRYQDLNEKWGEERRNLRTPPHRDYPRTSDEVDKTGAAPLRDATLADMARAVARGQQHYSLLQPGGVETERQAKNRREIGKTAKIWQQTLKDRGIEQPNGDLFGLGEYFLGKEIARHGVNQHPDTAMERLGVAGRRGIKEKGPEIGRRLAALRPIQEHNRAKRYLLDSFTTESTDRMTEIMARMEALWKQGKRGKELWDQIRPMLDAKAVPGE